MRNSGLKKFEDDCQKLWLELEKYINYLEVSEKSMVRQAFDTCVEIYHDQKRDNGQLCLEHKVEVAKILAGIKLDKVTIVSSFLYGSLVEDKMDTENHKEQFHKFPIEVIEIVEDVNKIIKLLQSAGPCEQEKSAENLRRMFVATGRDFRVFFIKLADRIDTLRNMRHLPLEQAQIMAQQSIRIDAEIASRMGINILKNKIEDAAFQYLHPKIWEFMVSNKALNFNSRTEHAKKLQDKTKNFLSRKGLPYLEIMGRAKGYYAVYNKLYQKGKSIDEIYDLIALRIIVQDIPKCFQALSTIHELFPEYIERTKNYIQEPKENGYQSIHTTVFDKESNLAFEFQIRTRQMHELAEYGAAAHWAYKKKVVNQSGLSFLDPIRLMNLGENLRRGAWNIFVKQSEIEQNNYLGINLFHDKIFILTPKGDVVSLPDQATALDFAYKIHQEVGNRAIFAKINGKLSNLNSVLTTGNCVEIITDSQQGPKKVWLNWSKTTTAHKMIKSFLREKAEQANKIN